jgi:hypothetical protein
MEFVQEHEAPVELSRSEKDQLIRDFVAQLRCSSDQSEKSAIKERLANLIFGE